MWFCPVAKEMSASSSSSITQSDSDSTECSGHDERHSASNRHRNMVYGGYSYHPFFEEKPVKKFLGVGYLTKSDKSKDNACCCHVTCALLVWLCFDISSCALLSIGEFIWFSYNINNQKVSIAYPIITLIYAIIEALYAVTVPIGLAALCLENISLFWIFSARNIIKPTLLSSVSLCQVAILVVFPYYKESRDGDLTTINTVVVIGLVVSSIWSFWWFFGAVLTCKCRRFIQKRLDNN